MKYIIFNRKTGQKIDKVFATIQEAIKEAEKQNIIARNYNFLVTNIKK